MQGSCREMTLGPLIEQITQDLGRLAAGHSPSAFLSYASIMVIVIAYFEFTRRNSLL